MYRNTKKIYSRLPCTSSTGKFAGVSIRYDARASRLECVLRFLSEYLSISLSSFSDEISTHKKKLSEIALQKQAQISTNARNEAKPEDGWKEKKRLICSLICKNVSMEI